MVGVGSVALTTLAAYARLIPYVRGEHGVIVETYASWMVSGGLTLDLSFRLDPLSALMLSFVTFVGFLIHVYSIGYMHHEATDAGYARFFSYLNLFLFAMLVLVLAESYVLLFVGWEGVGLCSYLLIGYYFDKEYAAAAGKKAFVVNRMGDYGFLLGMFGVFTAFGSLNFTEVFGKAAADPVPLCPGALAHLPVPLRRRRGQERPVPALRLAARRHGRPHTRLGPDPRRHDGHGRRVHDRALRTSSSASRRTSCSSSPSSAASRASSRPRSRSPRTT